MDSHTGDVVKVLVTGAPGWLGNRFLECMFDTKEHGWFRLPDKQFRLLVLPKAPKESLTPFLGKIDVVEGDVTRSETLDAAVRGVDCVIHIAGLIHPKKISELYALNTDGTRNLLNASVKAGVHKFVYVSSNSAGGIQVSREKLMTETDPSHPYLHYGLSKWLAENLVNEAYRSKKLETVILRPCWYYGSGQPERQTRFFRMIKKGKPILFGDGKNLRSMTYLDNLCQALALAVTIPRANGQTYWIADEKPYTTIEIYQTIARLLNVRDFKPMSVPSPVSECCLLADRLLQSCGMYISEIHVAGEMNKNIACSIEKAQRELGYKPTVALEEGMRRSIEWCRARGIEL